MYVRVKVSPGAKKERVVRTGDTEFEIAVKEPAEQNLANRRVHELIAHELGVSVKKVRIISGHRSPRKIFSVE